MMTLAPQNPQDPQDPQRTPLAPPPSDNPFARQMLQTLDAVPPLAPKPAGNPFVAGMLSQLDDPTVAKSREDRFLGSFRTAIRTDPDLMREATRIGQELGVAPDLLAGDIRVARQLVQARAVRYADLAKRSPMLAEKLADFDFARIAHDDVDNLATTESTFGWLGKQWDAGQAANERGWIGIRQALGVAGPDESDRLIELEALTADASQERGFTAATTRVLGQMSETVPAAVGAGIAASAVATPFAGAVAGGATTFALSGAISAGNHYIDMRARGIPHATAVAAAFGAGAVEGSLDSLSALVGAAPFAKAFGRTLRGARVLTRETAGAAFGQFVREASKVYVTENATELAQDVVGFAAEEAAAATVPDALPGTPLAERLADTFAETSRAMLPLSLPGPALHFAGDLARARQAEGQAQFFDKLAKSAAESKLAKGNPEAYGEFVDGIGARHGVENVYILGKAFGEALRQSGTEPEQLPDSVRQQVGPAIENGDDVVVPIGTYASRIAGTKLGLALRGQERVDPDHMPAGEAATFRQGEKEKAAEIVAETEQRAAAEQAFRTSSRAVEATMEKQLVATGKFEQGEARASSVLYGAFVQTQARRMGMLPERFAARYPLLVQAVDEPSGPATTLRQPTRGQFDPKALRIDLFNKADRSTFLHEAAHYFLTVYGDLAGRQDGPEFAKTDLRAILTWAGAGTLEEWGAKSLEQQRQAHEAFAASFETYLAEGKAPSQELVGVFARFKQWLVLVYKRIRQQLAGAHRKEFGADLPALSPEVRAVMDRMLASDDAVAHAEQVRGMVPLFTSAEEAGMSPEQWTAYQDLADEARSDGAADLNAASLRQAEWVLRARDRVRRELGAKADAVRAEVRAEILAKAEREPVYRALHWLRTGILRDVEGGDSMQVGGSHKLATEAVRKLLPSGTDLRKLGPILHKDGVAPDVAATLFGFQSGEHLLRTILTAPKLETEVDARTDAKMAEDHGELVDSGQVDEAIAKALHAEARARFVAVELQHLTKAVQPVRLMQQAARQAARQILAGKAIGEVRPRQHAVAADRAAREATRALRKGDGQGAAVAKRQQLVQIELARQAREIRLEVDKAARQFKRFFQPDAALAKTRNVAIVEAARSILAHFGFGEHGKAPAAYVEQLQQYNPSLYADLAPMIERATEASARTQDFRNLTVDEFRTLRDAVTALWHQARRDQEMRVEGQLEELGAIAGSLAETVRALGLPTKLPGDESAPTSRDEIVRDGMGAAATMTRVEHWSRAMGEQFTRYVWRPVRGAIDAYRSARNVYVKRYEQLLQAHRDAGHMDAGKIEAPELGYTFNGKAELIGALFHTGNAGNLYRMLDGAGWGEMRDDGTMDTRRWDRFLSRMITDDKLTKADFDLAQQVWDLNEELKPLAQKTHFELFGHFFEEVQARPFGMFGTDYRGGYVPAIADKFTTQQARLQDQLAELEGDFRQTVPSVPRGFTKSRADHARRRLSLDIRKMSAHIDGVLRFVHVQPAVRDVLRLVNHKELKGVLERHNPQALEKLLLPWLQRAARGITTEPGKNRRMDRIWNAIRANSGLALMFGNLSNALQNLTGLSTALLHVRGTHLRKALFDYMGSPRQTARTIAELSPFMADRMGKQVFEAFDGINDVATNPGVYAKAVTFARKHGYVLQRLTQNVVDHTTWLGAYNQALVDLGADTATPDAQREAVARADAAVRLTQGSSEAEDVSGFEVGTPFWRALTQFQGWFNNFANLNAYEAQRTVRELGWRRGSPRLFGIYVAGIAAPMVVAAAIAKTLAGTWDDQDDDGYSDEFADWLLASQVKGALATVPAFGQLGTLVWNVFTDDRGYNDRMPQPAALGLLESGIKSLSGLGNGATGREIQDASTLLTVLFGVPVSALGRPAGYLADVAEDRVQPTGAADFVRGLVTGRASEASRR